MSLKKAEKDAKLTEILGENAERGWHWLWEFATGVMERKVEKYRDGSLVEEYETPSLSDRLKVMMYLMDHYVGKPVSRLEVEPLAPEFDTSAVKTLSDADLSKISGIINKFSGPETVEAQKLPEARKEEAPSLPKPFKKKGNV